MKDLNGKYPNPQRRERLLDVSKYRVSRVDDAPYDDIAESLSITPITSENAEVGPACDG